MGAPNRFSRFRFCQGVPQSDGTLMLTDREPFKFRELRDNIRHVVIEGDTLWSLAGLFYRSPQDERPSRFWWAIADFQPPDDGSRGGPGANHPPIFDPTIRLSPGRILHAPSKRTLFELILNEARRPEFL